MLCFFSDLSFSALPTESEIQVPSCLLQNSSYSEVETMGSMALLSGLLEILMKWIMRSFSVFILACFFGLEIISLVISTWLELVKGSISLQLNLVCRIIMGVLALISLPARLLTSFQRERQMEQHLQEMLIEMENLEMDRKHLQRHLQITTKEHLPSELMLEELEEQHEKAINKINYLETELSDIRNENLRLSEIQGHWNFDISNPQKSNNILFQDLPEPKITMSTRIRSEMFANNPDIYEQRGYALSQSFFSAILSLTVGVIVWEAEDPCTPLVIALFAVMGMSLKSGVRFFCSIENKYKLASDAVALLSFNWFLLGMLTYPTLPMFARIMSVGVKNVAGSNRRE